MNNEQRISKKRILWVILTLLQMAFIFYMSASDAPRSSEYSHDITRWLCMIFIYGWKGKPHKKQNHLMKKLNHFVRKAAHFTEFAVLGALLFMCIRSFRAGKKKSALIALPVVLGAIYAVSDEVHQYFVPGRACAITDVLIDTAGVIFGVLVAYLITRRRSKQQNDAQVQYQH